MFNLKKTHTAQKKNIIYKVFYGFLLLTKKILNKAFIFCVGLSFVKNISVLKD